MESHPRISQLLLETQAYRDLDNPVILTSGELGIYYINTEKLVQDNGKFEEYGDDSRAMIEHAVEMMDEHSSFGEVIDILAEKVVRLLRDSNSNNSPAISGGQRRDWLFSGPVAYKLGLRHISVYKEGEIEIVSPGLEVDYHYSLNGKRAVHISDLLTEGSSCYRVENGEERGWIPSLRGKGVKVNDLIAVVTRLQGGEENLARQQVIVHPFVAIDEDFLKKYSKNPERAVAYLKNPGEWSEAYLRENGALVLLPNFDPKGGKLDRARKFCGRYADVLGQAERLGELARATKEKFDCDLIELVGGK